MDTAPTNTDSPTIAGRPACGAQRDDRERPRPLEDSDATPQPHNQDSSERRAASAREGDPYGLDPAFETAGLPVLDWLYRTYFRIELSGIDIVPEAGRCLIVANHSGTIPLDGLMLRTAMRLEHSKRRSLRWLTSDFIHSVPLLGSTLTRLGAVRESQLNAERLLLAGSVVAAFPEGIDGVGKLYRDRYRVQRFGGGGFIRLALRTQTPVVPCAIIGAEESSPMLYRLEILPRLLGLPYLPITPTFPWLGPAGLVPAPTKWRIVFGKPLSFAEHRPGAERNPELVANLANRVRTIIQSQLDDGLAQRRTIW